MLNILIPMSGPNWFDSSEYQYPKPLIEVDGMPIIEKVVKMFDSISQDKRFIFIVNKEDCIKFHLDDVLRLITGEECVVIEIDSNTKGAACSALMAIDYIDNDDPLLVSSSDHIILHSLDSVLAEFEKNQVDGGTVCFESVHPKWSFVRLGPEGNIVEAAEKRPLSKNAVAGLFYFRKGCFFVEAAKNMIEKGASVNDRYYVAPALNEMVLKNLKLEPYKISQSEYFNFYSPHKIKEYEGWLRDQHGKS